MSKQEKVKDYILYRIISGESPVASRLPSEREIAQTLNVSRVTLRLALDALINERIIEKSLHKGYTVIRKPENGSKVSRKAKKLAYVFYSSEKDSNFEQALSHSAMYKAIEKSVLQNNDTLVFQTGESFDIFLENENQRNDFDGVFISGTGMNDKIPLLMTKSLPFVLVDTVVQGLRVDSVSIDDFEAGYLCCEYMKKLSRKKLLYMAHYYKNENFLQPNYTVRRAGALHALEGSELFFETRSITYDRGSYLSDEKKNLLEYIRKNKIDGIICGTYYAYDFLRQMPELAEMPLATVCDVNSMPDEKDFAVFFDWNRLGVLSVMRMYEKLSDAYSSPIRIVIPVQIKTS